MDTTEIHRVTSIDLFVGERKVRRTVSIQTEDSERRKECGIHYSRVSVSIVILSRGPPSHPYRFVLAEKNMGSRSQSKRIHEKMDDPRLSPFSGYLLTGTRQNLVDGNEVEQIDRGGYMLQKYGQVHIEIASLF